MSNRWLDAEVVMLDANFRLKLKDRKVVDPALGQGLAYYVQEEPYLDHVKASGPQTEVRYAIQCARVHGIDTTADEHLRIWLACY